MAEKTAISWTDATFNPWWGCFKVSDGCKNCYAETFSKRTGHAIWGPSATTPRRFFADKHWAEPLKWNAAAEKAGTRSRVFSASMADVFEDHPDVGPHRDRLFALIERTPWLDWQLLTKRPENVNRMIPAHWHHSPPSNWWQGTSVEHQDAADERIPHLLNTPATVRFLSCEPLLGPVVLEQVIEGRHVYALTGEYQDGDRRKRIGDGLDWVIVGGESGSGHRQMDVDWLCSLVEQCREAGVAVFTKQDSGQYPGKQGRIPDELMLHQFPEARS